MACRSRPSWVTAPQSSLILEVSDLKPSQETSSLSARATSMLKNGRSSRNPGSTFSPCATLRSEERRVGKECRTGWAMHEKKIKIRLRSEDRVVVEYDMQ